MSLLCGYVRDSMCFSAARGTVGKDCSIVAIEDTVEEILGGGFVDFGLGCVVVKDSIEGEGLIFASLSSHARSQTSLGTRVFWVEDPKELLVCWARKYQTLGVQAFLVHDLDDGSDAFANMSLEWCGGQSTITQEEGTIVDAGQLSSLADGEGSDANGDGDGRGTVNCAGSHVCVVEG
jgi:hypothetical protein